MRNSPFIVREKETSGIVELLESTTLGTNGAHYKHLDTPFRIKEIDSPLFLSLERKNKVLGNVTFCKRKSNWYVRYFAFASLFQSSGTKKSKGGRSSGLKRELNAFFEELLQGSSEFGIVDSFYAYIDPNNEKSLWLSENLGFNTIGKICTQTYSRINPEFQKRCVKSNDWEELKNIFQSSFENHQFFFTAQLQKGPFYSIRNKDGEILACTKITTANWEIKRLPGKLGGLLIKVIPIIPFVNKLIHPKKHSFIVPEAVYVKNNDPKIFDELFQGILQNEKKTLIIWWVDPEESLYKCIKTKTKWGILNRIVGVNDVNVVLKTNSNRFKEEKTNHPFYVSGIDCI